MLMPKHCLYLCANSIILYANEIIAFNLYCLPQNLIFNVSLIQVFHYITYKKLWLWQSKSFKMPLSHWRLKFNTENKNLNQLTQNLLI